MSNFNEVLYHPHNYKRSSILQSSSSDLVQCKLDGIAQVKGTHEIQPVILVRERNMQLVRYLLDSPIIKSQNGSIHQGP